MPQSQHLPLPQAPQPLPPPVQLSAGQPPPQFVHAKQPALHEQQQADALSLGQPEDGLQWPARAAVQRYSLVDGAAERYVADQPPQQMPQYQPHWQQAQSLLQSQQF